MNSLTDSQSNSAPRNSKIQSFLEALRNSQNQGGENRGERLTTNPFAEFQQKKEIEKKRAEQFLQARQQEWNKVYSAKEKQTQSRISEIREQLKILIDQVHRLDQNLVKAASAPIAEVGEYHESFLLRLQRTIQLFSLEAQDTNSWLTLYYSRSTKKGYYLGMAKTGGTAFTQANERAVATSVGWW